MYNLLYNLTYNISIVNQIKRLDRFHAGNFHPDKKQLGFKENKVQRAYFCTSKGYKKLTHFNKYN